MRQDAANAVRKHFGHAAEQLRAALELDHLGVLFDEVSPTLAGSTCPAAAGIHSLAAMVRVGLRPCSRSSRRPAPRATLSSWWTPPPLRRRCCRAPRTRCGSQVSAGAAPRTSARCGTRRRTGSGPSMRGRPPWRAGVAGRSRRVRSRAFAASVRRQAHIRGGLPAPHDGRAAGAVRGRALRPEHVHRRRRARAQGSPVSGRRAWRGRAERGAGLTCWGAGGRPRVAGGGRCRSAAIPLARLRDQAALSPEEWAWVRGQRSPPSPYFSAPRVRHVCMGSHASAVGGF